MKRVLTDAETASAQFRIENANTSARILRARIETVERAKCSDSQALAFSLICEYQIMCETLEDEVMRLNRKYDTTNVTEFVRVKIDSLYTVALEVIAECEKITDQ